MTPLQRKSHKQGNQIRKNNILLGKTELRWKVCQDGKHTVVSNPHMKH